MSTEFLTYESLRSMQRAINQMQGAINQNYSGQIDNIVAMNPSTYTTLTTTTAGNTVTGGSYTTGSIPIVADPYVPAGQVYIIDPAKMAPEWVYRDANKPTNEAFPYKYYTTNIRFPGGIGGLANDDPFTPLKAAEPVPAKRQMEPEQNKFSRPIEFAD